MDYETLKIISSQLGDSGHFCLWRYEERDGRKTKIPYDPRTGKKARSNDPQTFAPFDDAVAALERCGHDGIGIGIFGDLVGIDIDHCINETGELSSTARYIADIVDSYTEYSPSGTGLHILCRAKDIDDWYSTDRYKMKDSGSGIEVYVGGHTSRFLTMTGNPYNHNDVNERGGKVREVLEEFMRRDGHTDESANTLSIESADRPMDEFELSLEVGEVMSRMQRGRDWSIIERLLDGEDLSGDTSADDLSLMNRLSFYSCRNTQVMDAIYRNSDRYREKWNRPMSSGSTVTYGQYTIRKAICGCREVWSPSFKQDASEVYDADVAWLKENNAAERFPCDDRGAGDLLGAFVKERAVFVEEAKSWFVYADGVWHRDSGDLRIQAEAKRLTRAVLGYAASIEDDDLRDRWVKFAQTWRKYAARCTYIAETRSVCHCSINDFDEKKYLLNVRNGTLDLTDPANPVFRDHDPADRLTCICDVDYDPSASSELWESTLNSLFKSNPSELEWLQREAGYSLAGSLCEEEWTVLLGRTSRNGKSTFCDTISRMFGSYAAAISPESFDAARKLGGGRTSSDLAKLKGKRWVVVSEPDKSMRLNATLLKGISGRDKLTARQLYQEEIDFYPQFHIIFNTNSLPAVDDPAVFASDRVHVVNFLRHLEKEERDVTLKDRLTTGESLSGVLNWCLEGRKRYAVNRLREPDSMQEAFDEWKYSCDKVAQFIDDCLEPYADYRETCTDVYSRYSTWCSDNGVYAQRSKAFQDDLKSHNIPVERVRPSNGKGATSCICGYRLIYRTLSDLLDGSAS